MRWLLVLDYVESEAQAHGGLEAAVAAGAVPEDPWELVRRVGDMAPHKICQFAFKRNDIVWICKDCQRDESAWCLFVFLLCRYMWWWWWWWVVSIARYRF